MVRIDKKLAPGTDRDVKVLQYGEGNFLRAFADYMFDVLNEKTDFNGSIVIVKPREGGNLDRFIKQDCRYTVSLRGVTDSKPGVSNRIITSVKETISAYNDYDKYMEYADLPSLRYVLSNTTEAGIVYDEEDMWDVNPSKTFPGKLTKLLFRRYMKFAGARDKGLIMLPCELIDNNAAELKKCIIKYADSWKLEKGFVKWLDEACIFASTLVDRIVSGFPADEADSIFKELGYEDELFVAAEPFGLWVIEENPVITKELPFDRIGLPVVYASDIKPYKQRKVRILNGAHTSFVPASFLCGNNIVYESMNDPDIYSFMHDTLFDEIIPTLSLPKEELCEFAGAVIERFNNPYVKHALLSICLNSVSKWRARCLPSLIDYVERFGQNPKHLTFSLAALIAFYSFDHEGDGCLIGKRGDEDYRISDDREVLNFFREHKDTDTDKLVRDFLSDERFFGTDLTGIKDTYSLTCAYLNDIKAHGMRETIRNTFH